MCQNLSGSSRGAYSSICVKFILTHMRFYFNAHARIKKTAEEAVFYYLKTFYLKGL